MRLFVLLALLLLALPGAAAAEPDAGEALARAAQRVEGASERARRLRAELDELAARIEGEKARRRAADSLLPAGELRDLLARSQRLADALAEADREVERERAAERRAAERTLEASGRALEDARRRGDQGEVARLEALRGRARALLAPGEPVLAAPAAITPTEDPDELREQADLLRDQRDRVLARLEAVRERLGALREEERVARELRRFLSEDELFGDAGRVVRVRRTTRGSENPPADDRNGVELGPSLNTETDGFGESLEPGGAVVAPAPVEPAPAGVSTVVGARPFGVGDRGLSGLPPLDGDESLDELARQELELRELARRLEAEARGLEGKASELDRD